MVHLISEGDVVPEDDDLLLQVIVNGVRTVGGDGDTLPLGAPVLDPIESHYGFSLSSKVRGERVSWDQGIYN